MKCENGHDYYSTINSHVGTKGSCRTCIDDNRRLKTFNEIKKIANSKGGKCLSVDYLAGTQKLKFICKEKHTWESLVSPIKRGIWCRICGYKTMADKRRNV